ncbi:MAG: Cysteine-rich [Acidobacteriota bacterium]|jgi:hypothetical protein|nr:Cysteine-rich [Acidobacteriota bacterium]
MNSPQSDNRSLPLLTNQAICEACGNEFACGAALGSCWCAEIELSDAARNELGARYSGCLCRTCLEGFAKGGRTNDEKEQQVPTGTAD